MPYRYLDDIATADVAFDAWGNNQREMFLAAADATINVMVANLNSIEDVEQQNIEVTEDSLDMLLFQFLQELIFYKDARQLLLRVRQVNIRRYEDVFILKAQTFGETLNPQKHDLTVDVKAVTLHRFHIQRIDNQWHATIILDV